MVSTTLMVNEPWPVLPEASVAEQLTVVAPRGNVSPESWSHVVARSPSTRSVAFVVKETAAPSGPVAS